ncbi:hypothetical protein D3C76_921740 [compost metagenome]
MQGESAGIDFAALFHELNELLVHRQMTRERFSAQGRKTALHAQLHAWPVQQDFGFEAFAQQTLGLKHIDQADGALEGDGVEGNQDFFAGFGLDVFEDFLFVIDQEVAVFVMGDVHGWHSVALQLLRA